MANLDFTGKVVLITGAGGGFGLAAAQRFAEAGARLVLTDYNDKALESARQFVEQSGYQAEFHAGDVASLETHTALVQACLSAYGRLDICLLYTSPSPRD